MCIQGNEQVEEIKEVSNKGSLVTLSYTVVAINSLTSVDTRRLTRDGLGGSPSTLLNTSIFLTDHGQSIQEPQRLLFI